MRANVFIPALAAAFFVCMMAACSKPATAVADAAPAVEAKPVVELPPPFSGVKLGMSQAELDALFPPTEEISSCEPQLVGGDLPDPVLVPGADKKARSACARSSDIGGPTIRDLQRIMAGSKALDANAAAQIEDGWLYALAQVRGSLRAGAVSEAALLQADHGRSDTAVGALTNVAEALFRGGLTFARGRKARREVCAVIADSCDDVDATRLRKYISGALSLTQIDADAHSRVVNGKCRGPYLQHEKALARAFAYRAGALGGIGLARASRPDRQLKADDASTFAVYSSRSELDAAPAKFGVLVANALPDAEKYWSGTVALFPADPSSGDWPRAVVWLRDGHVTRALVNVVVETEKLGDVPTKLGTFYGSAGTTKGTVTTWPLTDGTTVTLDIGAVASFIVENAGSRAVASTMASGGAGDASTPAPGPPRDPPRPSSPPPGPGAAHAQAVPAFPSAQPAPAMSVPATVTANAARMRQCCAAIRSQGKAEGATPDGTLLMNVAAQCDMAAAQTTPGHAPEFSLVRQIYRGRMMPAACAGI